MNDILIELLIPALGESLDATIPATAQIHEIIALLVKAARKQSEGRFRTIDPILCDCIDGIPLPSNGTPIELGLKNGARLMLI